MEALLTNTTGPSLVDPKHLPPSPPESTSSSPADVNSVSFLEQAYLQRRFGSKNATITHFLELWDYLGGCSFRGFIAQEGLCPGQFPSGPTEDAPEKTLFLFFSPTNSLELKNALIALIELGSECFKCENLVICIDREAEGLRDLVKDLGWVGFELVTLDKWMGKSGKAEKTSQGGISDKWLFVGMEL